MKVRQFRKLVNRRKFYHHFPDYANKVRVFGFPDGETYFCERLEYSYNQTTGKREFRLHDRKVVY